MEIVIERLKNIPKLVCPADGIVLLVGGNNAGKSSVLQAIQFGVSVAQTSEIQGGKWKKGRLSTSIGQSDLMYSPIKDVFSLAPNGKLKTPAHQAITITYKDELAECKVSLRKGKNKNITFELHGKELGEKLQSLSSPYCALVTGLAGIPSEESLETSFVVRKAAAKGDSNSVFRNILHELKADKSKWGKFQIQMKKIFPEYEIDVVTFDQKKDEYINCVVKKSNGSYPIDTCGTGVLQAIQIFSYINLFEPKILLLDEPDSHLHPNNQKALAQELIAASQLGLNIIISTHSKHLVEAMIDSSNLVWLRNGKIEPNVEKYELQALMDIGALNIGDRIRNPKYIFLTEDTKTELLKFILKVNGYNLNECEIESYSGCSNPHTAEALIDRIKKDSPSSKIIVHRDRDFLNESDIEKYKNRIEARGARVFIPAGNDIESYLCQMDHIIEALKLDENTATEILESSFNSRKNELLKVYINSRADYIRKNGEKPNAGEIAIEANSLLNGYTSSVLHGKTFLKGIRDELTKRGIKDVLAEANTSSIKIKELTEFMK